MTLQGVLVVDAIAIILTMWVLNLVRTGRLYIGYAVMFIGVSTMIIVAISVPPVLAMVTAAVGAVFPVSALTMIALALMAYLFVYVFAQLTMLSNRLASVVQELAIREAQRPAGQSGSPESEGGGHDDHGGG